MQNIKSFFIYLHSLTPKAKAEEGQRRREALKRRICSFA